MTGLLEAAPVRAGVEFGVRYAVLIGLVGLLASCSGGSSSSASKDAGGGEAATTAGPCAAKLPAARAGGAGEGHVTVTVSREAICVDDEAVVALIDGAIDPKELEYHYIEKLATTAEKLDASRREGDMEIVTPEGPVKPIKIQFDARTPFSIVVDTVYSLGRSQFSTYWYGVEGGTYLPVSPPRFTAMGGGSTPAVKVFVMEDGFRLGPMIPLADGAKSLDDPARWDLAGLDKALAQIEEDAGENLTAVVSAENTIPFGQLAAVYEVVRGPGCPVDRNPEEWTAKACRFPDVVVEAGAG